MTVAAGQLKFPVKKARVSIPEHGKMNGTEAEFAAELELWRNGHDIHWWAFEPVKLKLAASCFYTPDFMVLEFDQSLSFYEVKGFWRDDARVKIKTACVLFPMFTFKAVTKKKKRDGGGWKYEVFQ